MLLQYGYNAYATESDFVGLGCMMEVGGADSTAINFDGPDTTTWQA